MTDTATKAGPMPVRTILLIPDDAREGLLDPGAPICCWTPKVFAFGWACGSGQCHWDDEPGVLTPDLDGVGITQPLCIHLVLARAGAVVPEGVDRLCRVERSTPDCPFWEPFRLEGALTALLSGEHPPLVAARALFPLGTLVLLDENGAEVSGV